MSLVEFRNSQPMLSDYQAKIFNYHILQNDIARISAICNIGSLSLQTEALRNSLKSEVAAWQTMFARALIDMSLQKVSKITNYMTRMENLMDAPIVHVDIERMRMLSTSVQELQDFDANFEIELQPLSDGLNMLEQLDQFILNEDNSVYDVQSERWNQLQTKARSFTEALWKHRPQLLRLVQEEAQQLSFEAVQATSRMESHGPYAKSNDNIEVTVARMLQFTDGACARVCACLS